jgi:hypothetical protein
VGDWISRGAGIVCGLQSRISQEGEVMNKPTCGGTATASGAVSIGSTIGLVFGIIFSWKDILSYIDPKISSGESEAIINVINDLRQGIQYIVNLAQGTSPFSTFLNAILGPTSTVVWAAIIIAAAVTAAIMITWAWTNYAQICSSPAFGTKTCITGVVNAVSPAFGSLHSQLFAFTGSQPRADVVVKSIYWPVVTLNSPSYIPCAPCDNCPASVLPASTINGCSPEIPCFYHSSKVCTAAEAAAIGATVGAAIGAVLGVIAAIALMSALGCAATGILAPFCWLVLLLAVLVAIAVTAAVALIGAMAGSGIGEAVNSGSTQPGGSVALTVGAYVSVMGNLVQASQALGANTIWFAGWIPNSTTNTVDDDTASNNSGTSIYGQSSGVAPFCYTDPDANIPNTIDVCQN